MNSRQKTLPNELREILISRDEIIEDRFDEIIRNAEIIDIEEETDMNGLFNILSDQFSLRLGIEKHISMSFLKSVKKIQQL